MIGFQEKIILYRCTQISYNNISKSSQNYVILVVQTVVMLETKLTDV